MKSPFPLEFLQPVLERRHRGVDRAYAWPFALKGYFSPDALHGMISVQIDELSSGRARYRRYLVSEDTVYETPEILTYEPQCVWTNNSRYCAFWSARPEAVWIWDAKRKRITSVKVTQFEEAHCRVDGNTLVIRPRKVAWRKNAAPIRKRLAELKWKPLRKIKRLPPRPRMDEPLAELSQLAPEDGKPLKGKILFVRHEFRDMYHYFFLVTDERRNVLTLMRLGDKDMKDRDLSEPALLSDENKRIHRHEAIVVKKIRGLYRDSKRNIYQLWDGRMKPYRFV